MESQLTSFLTMSSYKRYSTYKIPPSRCKQLFLSFIKDDNNQTETLKNIKLQNEIPMLLSSICETILVQLIQIIIQTRENVKRFNMEHFNEMFHIIVKFLKTIYIAKRSQELAHLCNEFCMSQKNKVKN